MTESFKNYGGGSDLQKELISIQDIEDTSLSVIYEYKCILFSLDHAAYFAVSDVIQ